MIAKLEMTLSTAQQNKDENTKPHKTLGATIKKINNNRTTALETTAAEVTNQGVWRSTMFSIVLVKRKLLVKSVYFYSILYSYRITLVLSFNKKVSEYDQELPQSHTAVQPTAPWVRYTEQLQPHDSKNNHYKIKQPSLYSSARCRTLVKSG